MSADQLAVIKDPDAVDKYFVSVKGQKSLESGLQSIERESSKTVVSETVKAHYVVLMMEDRLLIVKAAPREAGTDFQGAVVRLPSDVRATIISPLSDRPDIMDAFFPVMLDATGFRNEGYWALAICVPVLVFAGWNFRKATKTGSADSPRCANG